MPLALSLAVISFAAPYVAVGAIATGLIPVLIHLIHRARYRRIEWAAMSFLLTANRRSLRHARLEQWLLLAIRTLIIVLLGLAIAGPLLTDASLATTLGGPVLRVILLDNSCSMQARTEAANTKPATGAPDPAQPVTKLAQAKQAAASLVNQFRDGDPIAMIALAGPQADIMAQPTRDQRLVRDRLRSITPTHQATDVTGALRLARKLIDESHTTTDDSAVYVISDMARTAWGLPPIPSHDPKGAEQGSPVFELARQIGQEASLVFVVPESLSDEHDRATVTTGNAAVTSLAASSAIVALGKPARFTAAVANFGGHDIRDAVLQVSRADRVLRRIPVPLLEAGQALDVPFSAVFDKPGTHGLEAKLDTGGVEDALPIDNTRHLSVEVRDSLPVLLIDGQPGVRGTRAGGAAGYLATALAPRTEADSRRFIEPTVIDQYELSGEVLDAYAVIALCDVHRLEPDDWRRLDDAVRRGTGLIVFVGDGVDADHYNRLGFADGKGVLPASLGTVIGDDAGPDFFVRCKHEPFTHPVLADFSDAADSGLFLARVRRYILATPNPNRANVLLRYTDNNPAIISQSHGAGRVSLVTTTANMDWTNLPAKGDYVSLMMNLVAHAAPARGAGRNVHVGGTLIEPSVHRSNVHVSGPKNATIPTPEIIPNDNGFACRVGPTDRAGFYRMDVGDRTILFAANIDPAESDLRALDHDDFTRALDCPFTYRSVADGTDPSAPAAQDKTTAAASIPLLWVVLVLLMFESLLATRFSRR